jgi:hypothetical protein
LGGATATTQTAGDNTTKVATTAFVIGQAATLAPAALGTAAVGASLKYAREDHVHTAPTGGVTSLNGQTGAITNTAVGDIGGYRLGITATSSSVNTTYAAASVYTPVWTAGIYTQGAAFSAGTWRCVSANGFDGSGPQYSAGLFVRIS